MKKIKKILAFSTIALLLSSCFTISDGNISNSSSAMLSSNNFRYVKTVEGKSSSTMIFGMGGSNDGLVKNAVNELRKELNANQVLTNITIDKNNSTILFGLIIKKSFHVSADVVEFE